MLSVPITAVLLFAAGYARVDSTAPRTGPCSVVLSGDTSRVTLANLDGVEAAPTRPPAAAPGAAALPAFPPEPQTPGYQGRALTSFVVDDHGGVEPGSVSIVEATDVAVARWACQAVTAMRFIPAEVRGRRVRALWGQPFQYRVPAASARTDSAAPAR